MGYLKKGTLGWISHLLRGASKDDRPSFQNVKIPCALFLASKRKELFHETRKNQ